MVTDFAKQNLVSLCDSRSAIKQYEMILCSSLIKIQFFKYITSSFDNNRIAILIKINTKHCTTWFKRKFSNIWVIFLLNEAPGFRNGLWGFLPYLFLFQIIFLFSIWRFHILHGLFKFLLLNCGFLCHVDFFLHFC